MSRVGAAVASCAIAVLTASGVARARPVVVGLAAAPDDAHTAIAIGPSGEAYAPSAAHVWTRRAGGGIAADVVATSRAGDVALAAVAGEPPYELVPPSAHDAGGWSVMNLGRRASAILGRGPRATAAVGKTVFALERGKATRIADAPAVVLALGASAKAIAVETERGLARWDGRAWKPLAKAPHHVAALLDARWALVDRGVVDLDSGAVTAWPAGFAPEAVALAGDGAIVAAHGAQLATIDRGKVARETIAAATLASPVVAIAADRSGRIVIATRDGELWLRERGAWTAGELHAELPPPHAGSPPAVSQ